MLRHCTPKKFIIIPDFTRKEIELLNWAIDGMGDHFHGKDVPEIIEKALIVPRLTNRVEDLLYRLEVQLSDMAQDIGTRKAYREAKIAKKLGEDIRKIAKESGLKIEVR